MLILTYSAFDATSIVKGLGLSEYSYWFVRKAFHRLLERSGIVVPVTNPTREVDALVRGAAAHGERCVYLSFDTLQKTALGLTCPTIPVFAWEFDTIPSEAWGDEPRNDWTMVLAETGCAITHSSHTVGAVRRAMGETFPVWSIPAPVHSGAVRHLPSARGYQPRTELTLTGNVIDAADIDLAPFTFQRFQAEGPQALRHEITKKNGKAHVTLQGVVYCSVFNPLDGRKNWNDLLIGFIRAFRTTRDATLVLKLTYHDAEESLVHILADLAKIGPFQCRVLLVQGLLPQDEYDALMAASSYALNTSRGEGQCLPLMEHMSAGRPAVTPRHTGMRDYVTDNNAFIIRTTEEPGFWPHDPRRALRCKRHRMDFPRLIQAYHDSYHAAFDPATYAAMSEAATNALALYCSDEIVEARLTEVFDHVTGARQRRVKKPARVPTAVAVLDASDVA
jgi:glycosyltransferase involved in cell wall biosynthesis